MKGKRLSITLPGSTYKALEKVCKEQGGRSMNSLIVQALDRELSKVVHDIQDDGEVRPEEHE